MADYCSSLIFQLKCNPRETPTTIASMFGLPGHALWNIPGGLQMGCRHAVIPLRLLDLPGASPEQPHPFNLAVLNEFCVYPGVKKLASAAYVPMLTSFVALAAV